MSEPPAAEQGRFGYQPALDGLRAVAVLAVFGYHASVPRLTGGFLGVDAFFVISGFLITTLLVREWEQSGGIALRQFWMRRARRLFPAIVLLLLGVAVYAAVLAPSVSLHSLRWDGLATLFYVANWRFVWSHQSYFEAAAGPSPLRHTWSLAVEEQWYLIWPLFLLGALRLLRGLRRRSAAVLAVVAALSAVASAVWMAVLTPATGDTSRAYFGTDTRAQALLVGAALAFALHRWPIRRAGVARVAAGLGMAGLAAGLAFFVGVDEQTRWMYHGGFLIAALAWAAVVVATLEPVTGPVRWLLARRPVVALGRVSYGFYLWLWPTVVVLVPSRVHVHGWVLIGLQAAVTIALATMSHLLIERPIRLGAWRGRRWWRPVPAAALAAVGSAAAIVLATAGATSVPLVGAATGGAASKVPLVPRVVADPPGLAPPSSAASPPPAPPGRPVSVTTLGDSVGFAMVWYAPPIVGVHLSTRAIPGCGVIPVEVQIGTSRQKTSTDCAHWLDIWRAAEVARPDVALVFLGGWEVFDPWVEGARLRVGTPAWRSYVAAQLEQGIAVLTTGTNTRVAFATVPCYRYDEPVLGVASTERNDPRRTDAVNALIREVVARHPGRVTLVDWRGFACPSGKPVGKIGGITMRPDGMHTDKRSTRLVWNWLAPIVIDLAHRPHV